MMLFSLLFLSLAKEKLNLAAGLKWICRRVSVNVYAESIRQIDPQTISLILSSHPVKNLNKNAILRLILIRNV